MTLFVGNLSFNTLDEDLRETRRSRGFGFVEMPSDDEARAAARALHETAIAGRAIIVNEARPKVARFAERR